MSRVFGKYGPAHPLLGRLAFAMSRPLIRAAYAHYELYDAGSRYARSRAAAMKEQLAHGRPVYLVGVGPSGHNSGVALVEVSTARGVRLISNDEEERYTGIKHYAGYPELSVESLRTRLACLGISAKEIHACVASWNYVDFVPAGARMVFEHVPFSLPLLIPSASANLHGVHAWRAARAPARLGKQLGLDGPMPIVAMRHHDNHAFFSYGVSPFNHSREPVMVTVLDGYGDDAAISLYVGERGTLRRIRSNASIADSLGALYSVISSTQGGWMTLSSEGRYMGASAWGNNDRRTNPYYRQLRQLFYFGKEGQVHVNRKMINWHLYGERRPYTRSLREILGSPIALGDMWNPDRVLHVEEIEDSPLTQERVDKAAATQLLFEDVLFHIIGYLIRRTGSRRLVLTGGTALNCVANLQLLEAFDDSFYERYLGKRGRLHLWVPPVPNDTGVAAGAAYHFALANGAPPGENLRHAFYCGVPPSTASIRRALEDTDGIASLMLGNVKRPEEQRQVADFAAYVVSKDGVLGFFQGAAETGPRALGHRSIVANPCNPNTLEIINLLVKFRERVRPLAPMATFEAARRYFELLPGASDDDYNAYRYMVLTARARPEAIHLIPAVIHKDGTARVQIVREESDPFTHAYLRAMGRRLGVEVSVNTSLNIASPIVQTPAQACEALKRSKGMSGIIMIGEEGDAFLAWHKVVIPPKDAGERLLEWYRQWQIEPARQSMIFL